MEKINLLEDRDLNKNLSVTLNFIKQNYGAIAKAILYVVPFILIGCYFVLSAFDTTPVTSVKELLERYSPAYFLGLFLLSLSVLTAITFTVCYVVCYNRSENNNVPISVVWKEVKNNIFAIFLLSILYNIAFAVGFILCIVPGIIVSIYFVFYMYIRVDEKLPYIACFKRSIQLIKDNWWNTFLYLFLVSIIAGFIVILFAIPLYIIMFARMLGASFVDGEIYTYIASLIYYIGYLFVIPLIMIALGVYYYSRKSDVDNVSLHTDIEAIGTGKNY